MSIGSHVRSLFSSNEGIGVLGHHIIRPVTDLGDLGARTNLFTIVGGEILLTCLYGTCVVAETAGGTTLQFDFTPTVGTGPSPMDNGAGNCNGLLLGALIAPQGDITLPCIVAGPLSAGPSMSMRWICKVGTIGITPGGAVDVGTYSFDAYYIPLTPYAQLVVS